MRCIIKQPKTFSKQFTDIHILKKVKEQLSDIHPRRFHLGSGVAGEDKLGQTAVLDAGLGGGSTHFAIF